jgi:hypothetical protein
VSRKEEAITFEAAPETVVLFLSLALDDLPVPPTIGLPTHSHRRTTKKVANNATSATSTTRMATRAKGISEPSLLPLLPERGSDRLQGVPDRGPRVGDGAHQVFLSLVSTLGVEEP